MIMTYSEAVQFIKSRWGIAIRDSRLCLKNARNGLPTYFAQGVLYYRSDKKYEMISE